MSNNQKSKPVEGFTVPEPQVDLTLSLTSWTQGYGMSEIELVYEALELSKTDKLSFILTEHDKTGEDVSASAPFWKEYQTLQELQRKLFSGLANGFFLNYLKTQVVKQDSAFIQSILIKHTTGNGLDKDYASDEKAYKDQFC